MSKTADMSALAAGLAEGSKPKAKPPQRRRSGRPKVDNIMIYQFKSEGRMLRKTVYFSPREWKAITSTAAAESTSATAIIRRSVQQALDLE